MFFSQVIRKLIVNTFHGEIHLWFEERKKLSVIIMVFIMLTK